jgi:modulator of FtsH protease HflK
VTTRMARNIDAALLPAHAILGGLRSSLKPLRWGILVLAFVYLSSGITVIQPNNVGLTLRFGEVLPQIHPPGLLFALPAPIDEVVKVPARTVQEIALETWATRKNEDGSEPSLHPVNTPYTLTGDANIIRARFSARYQVADPIAYEFTAREQDQLYRGILEDSVCRTLAGMSVDDVLTTRRDFVAEQTMALAQQEFNRLGLGIQLIAFEVREINPPVQVLPAFEDVVNARVEAKTLIEPANAYRASTIPQTEAKAYRIEQEATAWAGRIVTASEGRSAAFLALDKSYRASPERVSTRLYLDMLNDVLPKLKLSTVMPSAQGNFRILLAPEKAVGGSEDGTIPARQPASRDK